MDNLERENIIPKIVRSIRTEKERDTLHECIDALERSLYRTRTPDLDGMFKHIPQKVVDLLREALPSYSGAQDEIEVRRFLLNLKEELAKLRTLRLELAFEPSEDVVGRLHDWIRKELGEGIVLEIGYDPNILGGARLIFNGRYKEFTLSHMLDFAFAKDGVDISNGVHTTYN